MLILAAGAAMAQDDASQQPAPPPVSAFGQQNPAQPVSENPPISAIDQPGLDPHATAESFLLFGLHFSESADSNVSDTLGGSGVRSVSRGLGSLTLQKLWKNYDVALDYIGGAAYYNTKNLQFEQMQQLDVDNRINWKRGQLGIRDSFSYLPEGTFGFGAYGGGGAYGASLGSLGAGLLGSGAFAGQSAFLGGGNFGSSLGQTPRLMNLGLVDVVENLTPKSSVTAAGGYGIVHFYGNPDVAGVSSFIGSDEETAQVAYDRILTPRDQAAISYGYQRFNFSVVGTEFHSDVIQVMYGHRISGRMDFMIGAGPQFTFINAGALGGQTTRIGVAGRASLRYRFPKSTVALTYERFNTNGSGIFLGAETDAATLGATRQLGRVWSVFSDVGFARNHRLQPLSTQELVICTVQNIGCPGVSSNVFSYGYAGLGVHRQVGRSFRVFASYQFNDLYFDSTFCLNSANQVGPCNRISRRHVGTIGIDWTPRPIRLD